MRRILDFAASLEKPTTWAARRHRRVRRRVRWRSRRSAAEQAVATPFGKWRWAAPAARFAEWIDATPHDPSLRWPWPEARLVDTNAVLSDAAVAAGMVLDRIDLVRRGLELLEWLVVHDSFNGHLSPTPVGGAGPDDRAGRFAQRPVEVATMARAARRAFEATYDERWVNVVRSCARWFDGDNDVSQPMWDPDTGAGFDGIHAGGVDRNCGAESTLAAMATMQQHAAVMEMAA